MHVRTLVEVLKRLSAEVAVMLAPMLLFRLLRMILHMISLSILTSAVMFAHHALQTQFQLRFPCALV